MSDLAGVIRQLAGEHLKGSRDGGEFIYAECPFHDTKSGTPFYINTTKGTYGCFTCGARGPNLQAFLKQMGLKTGAAIRGVLEIAEEEARKKAPIERAKRKKLARKAFRGTSVLPASDLLPIFDNEPLDLVEEGFDPGILAEHHIGYDRDRKKITFPVFDIEGSLIGLSGRREDTAIGPKYKFYDGWHINGDGVRVPGELGNWFPTYSSDNIRDHLWRGQIVYPKVFSGQWTQIILVEGFKAALWLVQNGYLNTMAIMGSHMSFQQERIVRRLSAETFVFLDANSAGREGSEDICNRLGSATFPVYEVDYEAVDVDDEDVREKLQPSDLNEEAIDEALRSATLRTRLRRQFMRKKEHENG